MLHRAFAILAVVCLALGGSGCASNSNRDYEEVLMPLQTGSVLQRRVMVRTSANKKSKKKSDKRQNEKPRKTETEPTATPAPEEESTPPPDRFR